MSDTRLFRASAAAALALHAALLVGRPGLHGGGDLRPHLRLIELMREQPGLHNVYAPAYHALGALLAPVVGLAAYPEWFAWLSAAALIAGFRLFQRSAGLPDAAAALFAFAPYGFALSWCLPKVEAAGYAIALAGLAAQLRGRLVWVTVALLAAFCVHTAAALFLGLCGGVLALQRHDVRALAALAVGTALAAPLLLAHLRVGCTPAEALLFSQGDYLRAAPRGLDAAHLAHALLLANPIALALAVRGAPHLLRRRRDVAIVCAVVALLYANELWLVPFGARTTLDLVRGLTLFAIPVSAAAGFALEGRARAARGAVVASAALSIAALWLVVPATCVSKPVAVVGVESIQVDRCRFRWTDPQRPPDEVEPR
ncbi:MAG TPA: hypothetical protein VMW19_02105 [Myxococcota bacterium]|nr:hypothetical protein [Myxococcota bacterium]